MLPDLEHSSFRQAFLSLFFLLAVAIIIVTVLVKAGGTVQPIPWMPLAVTTEQTVTSTSGWWQSLPTPAPVLPDPMPVPKTTGD